MSSLANGTEDMVGQNLTPGAAYPVVNAALQKLAQMNLHEQVVPFYGLCRDNQQRGKSAITVERAVKAVEIRLEGDAPTGGSFTVQLVINGVLNSTQTSVGSGATYALVDVSSANIVIPANQPAEVKIISANAASDAIVTLKSQLRIL